MFFFEVKLFKFIIFVIFCFNMCKIFDVIIVGFRVNGLFIVIYFIFSVIENVFLIIKKSNKNVLLVKIFDYIVVLICR